MGAPSATSFLPSFPVEEQPRSEVRVRSTELVLPKVRVPWASVILRWTQANISSFFSPLLL